MRPQRFSCGILLQLHRVNREVALASMRPQRFSWGIRSRSALSHAWTASFNEAAAFLLRNRDRHDVRRADADTASMRPQRFSCGILRYSTRARQNMVLASMRPQCFSCGISVLMRAQFKKQVKASMRPQRFSCGIRASR